MAIKCPKHSTNNPGIKKFFGNRAPLQEDSRLSRSLAKSIEYYEKFLASSGLHMVGSAMKAQQKIKIESRLLALSGLKIQ